ncbi:MAG: patatin-like phospholipase family protein, partial [Desulfobacterales bacterium]|nr:patatin-like phospholipase family protein [Desulfobacterales bacterium]
MRAKLVFLAGKRALHRVRDKGLDPDDVKIVAGAAGGPKWLILGQLDRFLFGQWFQGRAEPLFLLGSSIGSWRFAAASRREPVAALDRFETAYIHQAYTSKPSPAEVTRKSREIMDAYLGATGVAEVLSHPCQRLSLFTVRSRHLLAADHRLPLALGLMGAVGANMISRRLLKFFFRQTLFSDDRSLPPFKGLRSAQVSNVSLTIENLKAALLASGSIPYVMQGIRDIP